MARICGFLVVRKPEENYDPGGRGAFYSVPPKVDHIFYGGLDRMLWFDVEEAYYSRTAPPEIAKLYKAIKQANADFSGVDVCQEAATAQALLEYSNRNGPLNELIAVYSPRLAEIKGTIDAHPCTLQSLGYDILALGHWSLLEGGLFVAPGHFNDWKEHLNEAGLFETAPDLDRYLKTYTEAASQGAVEDVPKGPFGVEVVEIMKGDCSE